MLKEIGYILGRMQIALSFQSLLQISAGDRLYKADSKTVFRPNPFHPLQPPHRSFQHSRQRAKRIKKRPRLFLAVGTGGTKCQEQF